MTFMVVLIAICVLPAILLAILKTNATITFLSFCTGYVLLRFVGEEAILAGTAMSGNRSPIIPSVAQIGIMLLPAVLSALVLRGSVTGPKLVANFIPGLAFGLLAALLTVPLLPGGVQYNIMQTEVWRILDNAKSLIAGGGILLSLMTLWLGHRRQHHDKHKKHH